MADSPWKTNSSLEKRQGVNWPSAPQALKQIGLLVVIGAIGGSALAFVLSASGGAASMTPAAAKVTPTQAAVAIAPTVTSIRPAASATMSTPIPTSTDKPTAAATLAAATATPTAMATATSTAAPTSTNAPVPTATSTSATGATAGSAASASFAKDVLPVLERRCVNCHGGEKIEASLSLRSYADVMKGSENGPVVEPRNAANSPLFQLPESGKMPKRGPRLLPAELQVLKDWIQAGAPNN